MIVCSLAVGAGAVYCALVLVPLQEDLNEPVQVVAE